MTAPQDTLDTDELLHVALAAMKADNDAAALEALKRLLVLEPEHAAGQHLLGAQYAQLEMYERAEQVWTRLLAQSPALSTVRLQLSQLLMAMGKAGEARRQLAPLLQEDGAMASYAAAINAALDGDEAAAARALRAGLALDPPSDALAQDMSRWLQRLAGGAMPDVPMPAAGVSPPVEGAGLLLSRYLQQV